MLKGTEILSCSRLALDSIIIDLDGVSIETDRQPEANYKDDLSMLVIFQYSHRYAEVESQSVL